MGVKKTNKKSVIDYCNFRSGPVVRVGLSTELRIEAGEYAQSCPLFEPCCTNVRSFELSSRLAVKESRYGVLKFRRSYSTTICKVPGTSLSPGRLNWALLAQGTELEVQKKDHLALILASGA